MTDNEIRPYDGMTTLEQLNLYRNLHYCEGLANERGIIANAINDIIVQFNRQKAELEKREKHIEELNEQIEHLVSINGEAEEEIEDVKRRCDVALSLMQRKEECIKAEAIKEFAERLKAELRDTAKIDFQGGYYYLIGVPFVDNLVEEMVGE